MWPATQSTVAAVLTGWTTDAVSSAAVVAFGSPASTPASAIWSGPTRNGRVAKANQARTAATVPRTGRARTATAPTTRTPSGRVNRARRPSHSTADWAPGCAATFAITVAGSSVVS